ncbi:hypothetical protein [Flaviaesturariibacter aridisoli]|uniref:Uncharacterized protein n=1 Tax=Flaviaesturariibacter aridisoli TaxID=2545761 RepID=A0A4R4E057_9BACT|nr:hypothetical protein [Flaviaesturariibacter aridisoli]TCZ70619.1 hypothetical protein E0486_10800 [Flaviaesturariibacter aridisoli]
MKPILLAGCLLGLLCTAQAQRNLLLLKRGNRTVARYWEGGTIAFQLNDGSWQKGELIALRNDSVFIKAHIVRYYQIGNDTLYLPVQGYAQNTITAFPRRGVEVDFRHGEFGISNGGNLIGKLMRIGAVGYTALSLANGLREGTYSLSGQGTELAIAGGVFAAGYAIDKWQRYTYRIGRKYHIDIIRF